MSKLKIQQVKSGINRNETQKRTIRALGFTKVNEIIEIENTPQIMGMLNKVQHLVSILKN